MSRAGSLDSSICAHHLCKFFIHATCAGTAEVWGSADISHLQERQWWRTHSTSWAPTSHGTGLPQRASDVLQLLTPTGIPGTHFGSCTSSQTLDLLGGISRVCKWVNTNQSDRSSGDRDKDSSTRTLCLFYDIRQMYHTGPPKKGREREGRQK